MGTHIIKRLHRAFADGVNDPNELVDILMDLPKEVLRPAVNAYVLTFISARTRQAQKKMLKTTKKAKEMSARSLAGEKGIDPDIYREAVLDCYRNLLHRTFHVPSVNGTKTWGEATADEHLEHVAYRKKTIAEYDRTIIMHQRASEFLKKNSFPNINSIVDEAATIRLAMSLY